MLAAASIPALTALAAVLPGRLSVLVTRNGVPTTATVVVGVYNPGAFSPQPSEYHALNGRATLTLNPNTYTIYARNPWGRSPSTIVAVAPGS
jgi:hypothetical protein